MFMGRSSEAGLGYEAQEDQNNELGHLDIL